MAKKRRDGKKERRHKRHEDVEAELSSPDELEEVRETEAEEAGGTTRKAGNVFINTLNVFGNGLRGFGKGVRMVCDPALKVCYPVARRVAGPVRTVLDPVAKVCYPPLKTHYETRYKKPFPKHAPWVLALDLSLLFLLGALVVGLMFVKLVLPGFPQPDIVRMQLLRPNAVTSGEPTSVVIAYSNGSGSPLADAKVSVELPDQFVVSGTTPVAETPTPGASTIAHTQALTFFVGTVPGHGRGQITIDGTPYGPTGSVQTFSSTFSFWKAGDTAPERAVAYHRLDVSGGDLTLGLQFDAPFLRGTSNAVRITYENTSERTLSGAEVRLAPPTGFTVTGSVPPTSTPGAWKLGDLPPGRHGTLVAYGVLSGPAVPSFAARAYVNATDGSHVLAQETQGNADAVSTGFVVTDEIVGTDGATAVRPGDTVHVRVHYHNGGDKAVVGARIRLAATDRYLTEPAPSWEGGDLDHIAPGSSGTLDAVLHVKDAITSDMLQTDTTPVIRLTAVADFTLDGDPARTFRIDSGATDLAVATKVGLQAASVYRTKDGEQLGIGPVPPKVGGTTRFWAVVKITNGSSAAQNGRIEATLPAGVKWTGKFSVTAGQPIAYLADQNKLVWNVGTVPAFADGSQAGASVELSVTPTADEAGTAPTLLKNITFTGEDTATGLKVHAAGGDVTTAVMYGTTAEKAGLVQK